MLPPPRAQPTSDCLNEIAPVPQVINKLESDASSDAQSITHNTASLPRMASPPTRPPTRLASGTTALTIKPRRWMPPGISSIAGGALLPVRTTSPVETARCSATAIGPKSRPVRATVQTKTRSRTE